MTRGVLAGLRIVEIEAIGPAPFCATMLADHGASVIRVARPGTTPVSGDPLARSRESVAVDLKHPDGAALVRELAAGADGLIEGFRPGVMERLGLGPNALLSRQPRLVYGRMTGWGQDGPLADRPGHDIDYIALAGVLHACGRAREGPVPPLNLVGDFGGGGMMLAFGMVAALLAVQRGAPGQVVDCAMTEGAAMLAASTYGKLGTGRWRDERGVNLLDGGAPFYTCYACADGGFVAVGALEPLFYARLLVLLGLTDDPRFAVQHDESAWPEMHEKLSATFATRPRDAWCALAGAYDACLAPVLSLTEAPAHPHAAARNSFIAVGGTIQPSPTPRFSASGTRTPVAPAGGTDATAPLVAWGCDEAIVATARAAGALGRSGG